MEKETALTEKETKSGSVDSLGAQLNGKTGRRYWKSLEQLAETPEFQKWVDDEFPHRSTLLSMDRRQLVKYMGAGMMLAGLSASGCRKLPEDRLVPFITGPEDRDPRQACVLLLDRYSGRVFHRPKSKDERRSAHQARWQPTSPGESRSPRRAHAGESSRPLRSGPAEASYQPRGHTGRGSGLWSQRAQSWTSWHQAEAPAWRF